MSDTARNYVYQVKIHSQSSKSKEKPEPTISMKTLESYQAEIAKYLNLKK